MIVGCGGFVAGRTDTVLAAYLEDDQIIEKIDSIPDPAQAERHLREFHRLLIG